MQSSRERKIASAEPYSLQPMLARYAINANLNEMCFEGGHAPASNPNTKVAKPYRRKAEINWG